MLIASGVGAAVSQRLELRRRAVVLLAAAGLLVAVGLTSGAVAEWALGLDVTGRVVVAGSVVAVVGFALGLIAALRPNSWVDNLSMGIANLGVAVPAFWLGILLILLFALTLGWLPATGQGGGRRLILPAVSLGGGYSAIIARLGFHDAVVNSFAVNAGRSAGFQPIHPKRQFPQSP